MKIKSLSDLPEALFFPLKEWVTQSPSNLNFLVGLTMLMILIGMCLSYYLLKKIGKPDERTNEYYKKLAYVVLVVIIICDIIFPKSYMPYQFYSIKYSLAVLIGSLYLFRQYRKDFK
ncbi:DUF2178 domain-containing protein [Carnobacterium divergens]|uniref:DUF2178 domain-containing protein n=1 Tax=Carnobacterium divergens TaxID=2748 RepID=UPI001072EC7C|nr:DUF2178 domain-containing protein [Carnobacterium divergens]TFJ38731.1 DUF2178 domain-containing protein [Carnobacterium divergens]TFJ47966.1 DUF2178 domain-containing protein [Carnobacterium divergens]TFJ52930.1 DUF2178 domain-containing protein [Carnobacterium divergens]TFJ58654.1 DUF2178 domain-containing protein [Carnobacterium divergens]TFJ68720.1 DUF2178 domain-containing protein [Carnobacterium divergens]